MCSTAPFWKRKNFFWSFQSAALPYISMRGLDGVLQVLAGLADHEALGGAPSPRHGARTRQGGVGLSAAARAAINNHVEGAGDKACWGPR